MVASRNHDFFYCFGILLVLDNEGETIKARWIACELRVLNLKGSRDAVVESIMQSGSG